MSPGAPHEDPTLKTGTSQDLLTIVTADSARYLAAHPTPLPSKTAGQRLFLELPLVLFGKAAAALMSVLPAEAALRVHERFMSLMAAPRSYPFDAGSLALARARELAQRLERETGSPPALIALISHAPVRGEMAHLNFELVRHALLALRAVRARPCRPRLVAAIDPFALDTASLYQEGAYAGFMGSYHLGIDRMAVGRNRATRWLLPLTSWECMAHRLLLRLGGGGEVGMVLAGGVPSTTRILYAAREWVGTVRRKSPLRVRPQEALRGLRQLSAFARFESSEPYRERLRGSATRLAEAYVKSFMARVFSDDADNAGMPVFVG